MSLVSLHCLFLPLEFGVTLGVEELTLFFSLSDPPLLIVRHLHLDLFQGADDKSKGFGFHGYKSHLFQILLLNFGSYSGGFGGCALLSQLLSLPEYGIQFRLILILTGLDDL